MKTSPTVRGSPGEQNRHSKASVPEDNGMPFLTKAITGKYPKRLHSLCGADLHQPHDTDSIVFPSLRLSEHIPIQEGNDLSTE